MEMPNPQCAARKPHGPMPKAHSPIHSALGIWHVALLLGLATGGLAGCVTDGNGKAGQSSLTMPIEDLANLGLRQNWASHLELFGSDRIQQATFFSENNTLVVLTDKNICYTVDTASGRVEELAQIAPETAGNFLPPTFDGQHYFFAGPNRVVGLNANTHVADINIKLEMPSHTQAIADPDFVYTGSMNGQVFASNIKTQVLKWASKVGPAVIGLAFSGKNIVIARSDVPTLSSGGKGHAELTVIRPRFWDEVWGPQIIEGTIKAPIVTTPPPDDAIFVACENGNVLKLNPVHGWSEWTRPTPGILVDAPLALSDRLVQIVPNVGTWIIGRVKGDVLWKDPQRLQYLGQSKDKSKMYFYNGQAIIQKNAATGKTEGSVTVPVGGVITVPDPDGTKLFLFTKTGDVLCLNDVNVPWKK